MSNYYLRPRNIGSGMRPTIAALLALAAILSSVLLAHESFSRSASPFGARLQSSPTPELTRYVDPLIGTAGTGDVFPGAALPFGMMQWSPDTSAGGLSKPGGYNRGDLIVTGFSLTHLSGAGCVGFQDVPFLPTVRPIRTPPLPNGSPYSDRFVLASERASPGYYGVRLASGIAMHITVTRRTGLADISFPASSRASVLVNAGGGGRRIGRTAGAMSAWVQIRSRNEVLGSATSGHFCGLSNRYTIYFAAQFDRPFGSFGTWTAAGVHSGARTAAGRHSGAFVTFDTRTSRTVRVKVGLSFVSAENALLNLRAENRGWNFADMHQRATVAWNTLLNRILVSGGTPGEMRVFYTALYHSLLHPNIFSDANGQYVGFDGKVRQAVGYTQYANFSGWDIYRTQVQLLSLLAPRTTAEMMQSLVADAQQSGWLPKWPVANENTGEMDGDSADAIIADAYAFGARDFDLRGAFAYMLKGATAPGVGPHGYEERPQLAAYLALGYVPRAAGPWGGAATTLEYAIDDFAIARMAKSLGAAAVYTTFARRAQNWKHLFNPLTGFMEPRVADGTFPTSFSPTSLDGFVEGNSWQYSWMVPQNLRALFRAMGGNQRVIARLNRFFTRLNAGERSPYNWAGNEPGLEVPWEYNFAGAPWRTQAVVRRILTSLYTPTPYGLPGNDDLGTMSAWCVWASLGLYPEIPGVAGLAVGSPLFPRAVLRHGDSSETHIVARGAGPTRPYIRSLQLDGRPYASSWLPLTRLAGRHTLHFDLTIRPNSAWGSAPAQSPPSFP